jgi:hypothetical protein
MSVFRNSGNHLVRVSCPQCGRFELDPSDLILVVAARPEQCVYVFVCPSCDRLIRENATQDAVVSLVSIGVETLWLSEPDEPGQASDALTAIDLAEFMVTLAALPTADREELFR